MSVEVKIRKGEPIERALRRLKKRLDREGVIRDVRAKRYFEKPCEVRRRKKKPGNRRGFFLPGSAGYRGKAGPCFLTISEPRCCP